MIKLLNHVAGALVLCLLLWAAALQAQISTGEIPFGIKHDLDVSVIPAEYILTDKSLTSRQSIRSNDPLAVGVSLQANLVFSQHAVRSVHGDSLYTWRMKVHVPGAGLLGMVFSQFKMGEGDKLFIYDESRVHYTGAFTSASNTSHGLFSTHILPASTLIIEYVTADPTYEPPLVLNEMINVWEDDQLSFFTHAEESTDDIPCHVNINCPEGENWQKQKRGIARLLIRVGSTWHYCTGTLINNTEMDQTPYMLTADHCGENASAEDMAVTQIYFNYEYIGCTDSGSPPRNMMITGAEIKARAPLQNGTDFKLLLLSNKPPLNWQPYYNGWTRFSKNPDSGVSIHHAGGSPKKISTFTKTLTNSTYPGGLALGYWGVEWSRTQSGHGITEGGSSGAPLFDSNGLIVGTLAGGSSTCTFPTLNDFFGKFYLHWKANGLTPERSLNQWLDPFNQNPEHLNGFDPGADLTFVRVIISPENGGIVNGAGYYTRGETASLSANPRDNYRFIAWKNASGLELSTEPLYEFEVPQGDIVLTAEFATIKDQPGIDSLAFRVKLYPNPTQVYVDLEFENSDGSATIDLWSITGQKIRQYLLNDTHIIPLQRINLQGLNDGIYLMRIHTNSGTAVKKIHFRKL